MLTLYPCFALIFGMFLCHFSEIFLYRELLIPWVHYVPLNDDATDVEEKMQWIIDHDIQAQAIAETASLWIEDLCFHPNAAMDDRYIQEELIRRYLTHFVAASEEQ